MNENLLFELITNFRLFAKENLKIKDKSGEIVPLILNAAQEIVLTEIERMIQAGEPVRLIILKARQKGISTFVEAYIFWRTTFKPHRKSAVLGHVRDATDNLFDMTNRYYNYLPAELQPKKKYHNSKELTFEKTESEMIFWTAETGDVGSSHTIQDLHLTEVSKWRDAKTTLTALLQTVPDQPNTLVIMESTANGLGGEFYNRWQDAKNGKSNYKAIFLSWLIDDEYTLKFKDNLELEQFKANLDSTEMSLLKVGASYEHLNWRRKIGLPDKCGNDPDKFKQEYPSNDVEAFITSGNPVFNIKTCHANYEQSGTKKIMIGDLVKVKDDQGKERVEFIENTRGFIKLYDFKKHKHGEKFVFAAGADIAEGLEQGDYSVIKVLDRRSKKVVLTWRGHIDPDLLAEEELKIQEFCGKDFYVCNEFNNHGGTVVNSAYKLGVNQYYREDYSTGMEVQKDILGFKTTTLTKPLMINRLNEAIRENYFDDADKQFWEETITFVKNSKGQMTAQNKDRDPGTKCFDDSVMASALMLVCDAWLPPVKYEKVDNTPNWLKKLQEKQKKQKEKGFMTV